MKITYGGDTILVRPQNWTIYYSWTVSVRSLFEFSFHMLFTYEQALKTMTVAKVKVISMEPLSDRAEPTHRCATIQS